MATTTRPIGTTVHYAVVDSPIDPLLLTAEDGRLTGLFMAVHRGGPQLDPAWQRDEAALAPVVEQLHEYFAGERTTFDIPLAPRGTPFQLQVWEALREIPYGTTTSYGELARRIGADKASRAVGLANGRNPISIVVPCHRVIGADGSLTGYGGGLERKRHLLDLESRSRRLL
ncbi:MAG: cysteine methyltransferase [Acidimicrobiales bacterium]|nr:cysteine methyltransferase [Acidimicrobiales bacterium]